MNSDTKNINEDFVINLQNTNEKNDDIIVIRLQSSTIQIPYYQLCKYSQLIQNEYLKSTAQERLSNEIRDIQNKYKLKDSSIIMFFKILNDVEVKITNDQYHDLFELSEIFQVRSLQTILQIYSKRNFKDVNFIINSVLKVNRHINERTFNRSYLVQMEDLLSDRIDECYQNELFGELNVSIVLRIIQKSYQKNKINTNLLYEFIRKCVSQRFPLFTFINISELSKKNFDDLYNDFNKKKGTDFQSYYKYLPIDIAFIKQFKDIQTKQDEIEKLQAKLNQLEKENQELNQNQEKLVKENVQLKCQVQMLSPKREEVTPVVLKKKTEPVTAEKKSDQNCNQLKEQNLNQKEINLDGIKVILANYEKRMKSQGKGQTLLHIACESKNIQIVKYILSSNSNIDLNSRYSRDDQCSITALQIAIENNDMEIIQLLLQQQKLDVNNESIFYENNRDTTISKCPLHTAVEAGNVSITNILLNHPNIDVNRFYSKNSYKNSIEISETALHIAFEKGNDEIISLLLAHKNINVNTIYSDGKKLKKTALHIGIENNRTESVKLLLNHPNIEVNIGYKRQYNSRYFENRALDLAIQRNNIEIIRSLLSFPNLDINFITRNDSGSETIEKTAFILAVENNKLEIVQLLLAYKNIDVNIKRKISKNESTQDNRTSYSKYKRDEHTALYIAAQNQNIELIQLLIDQSEIDPNNLSSENSGENYSKRDYDGNSSGDSSRRKETSALYWAIENKKIEIIKILISSSKVNLNIKYKSGFSDRSSNEYGKSYSSYEICNNNREISEEKSALFLATEMQEMQIIKLLLENNNIEINSLCKYNIISSNSSSKSNSCSCSSSSLNQEEEKNSLYLAVKRKNFEIVRALLAHPNIDVNAISKFNSDSKSSGFNNTTERHFFTPLHFAIKERNQAIIIMLMKHAKIDINAKDDEGKTPIELMNDEQMLSLISCLNK